MVPIGSSPFNDFSLPECMMWQDGMLWRGRFEVRNGTVVEIPCQPASDADVGLPLVIPGFVDVHTHLREPGQCHKEDVQSGTQAAARGGYTCVTAMPNTEPPLDSAARLRQFRQRLQGRAVVEVQTAACLTLGRKGFHVVDIPALADQGVRVFTDDGDGVASDELMRQAMLAARDAGAVVANHCEVPGRRGVFHSSAAERLGASAYPVEAETQMLQRDLALVRETGCRYHAMHLSAKESVDLIRQAKAEGLPVTAEATPHHLTLTADDIAKPTANFKMNPPLRDEVDRQALVQGLLDGTIDVVATDHAPHGREKEQQSLKEAAYGVTGLETCFAACFTHLVDTGSLPLERLLQAMIDAPARLLGLRHRIRVGDLPTFAVLDLRRVGQVTEFVSKGTNSPYLGRILRGWCTLTVYKGQLVWDTMEFWERRPAEYAKAARVEKGCCARFRAD